jgi:hypothetical protein
MFHPLGDAQPLDEKLVQAVLRSGMEGGIGEELRVDRGRMVYGLGEEGWTAICR